MAKELTTRMRRRPLLAPLLIPMLGVLAAGAGIYWIGTWGLWKASVTGIQDSARAMGVVK